MSENLGSAVLYLGADDSGLRKDLQQAETTATRTLGTLKKVAVGAGFAAAGAVAAIGTSAFKVSADTDKATKKIRAQLRLTEKESQRLGKISQKVWADNFAGSIEEAGEAVMLLTQQMGDAARDQEQELVSLAFSIQDAYGQDIKDVVAEASTLVNEFGISGEQAMDFIAAGFQKGMDKSGDFLDSIGEYSNQFAGAGFSAAEFFSLMETGQAGGVLGTDKMADAFKEFQIRLLEGSDDVTEALDNIGLSSEDIMAGLSDGTLEVKDVFEELLPAIAGIEDPLERNRALVELMGTQAEDLGIDFASGLDTSKTSLDDMTGAAADLETQYNNLQDNIAAIGRTVVTEITPLTDDLLLLVNDILPQVNSWVQTHLPALVTAIQNFRAAPLMTLLSPTEDDWSSYLDESLGGASDWFKENLGGEMQMSAGFAAHVAKRRVLDLFGIPEDSDTILADALTAAWEGAKTIFDAWMTEGSQAIADLFDIPDGATLSEALQTIWGGESGVKATFESWLQAGQQIAELFFIPLATDVVAGLQTWWPDVRSGFEDWLTTAGEQIADLFSIPTAADLVQSLKDMWQGSEGVRQTFEGWLSTAGEFISDLIDVPTAADVVQALKDWWGGNEGVRATFQAWLVSANEQIQDLLYLPDATTAAAGLQTWWTLAKSTFETWLTTSGEQITDLIGVPVIADVVQGLKDIWEGEEGVKAKFESWLTTTKNQVTDFFAAPDADSFLELLKGAWLLVSRRFVAFLLIDAVYGQVRDFFGVPEEAGFLESLKLIWGSIRTSLMEWLDNPENKIAAVLDIDSSIITDLESFIDNYLVRFREFVRLLWDGPEGEEGTEASTVTQMKELAGMGDDGEEGEGKGLGALSAIMASIGGNILAITGSTIWNLLKGIAGLIFPGISDLSIDFSSLVDNLERYDQFLESIRKRGFIRTWKEIFGGVSDDTQFDAAAGLGGGPPGDTGAGQGLFNFELPDITQIITDWWTGAQEVWDEKWNGLKQTVIDWWVGVKEHYGIESEGFQAGIDLAMVLVGIVWQNAWAALKTTVSTWWTNLKAEYGIESTGFQSGIDLAMAMLNILWQNAWDKLKQIVADWWTKLKEEYGIESDGFQAGIDLAMVLIEIVWQNAWDGIKQIVADAWAGIKDYVKGIVNDIIAEINGMIGKINKMIGDWNAKTFNIGGFGHTFDPVSVGGVQIWGGATIGWDGIDIPTPDVSLLPTIAPIEDLATGGIVQAVPGGIIARLGEGGHDEAVIPLDSSRGQGMLGGAGGPQTVIYAEQIIGFESLKDVLAEAGVDIQISGATSSFAGI